MRKSAVDGESGRPTNYGAANSRRSRLRKWRREPEEAVEIALRSTKRKRGALPPRTLAKVGRERGEHVLAAVS